MRIILHNSKNSYSEEKLGRLPNTLQIKSFDRTDLINNLVVVPRYIQFILCFLCIIHA